MKVVIAGGCGSLGRHISGDLSVPQMTGVAQPWEAAFDGANTTHGVILRTSIVLDRDSPALRRLVGLTKAGLGGRVGDGRQWFSWIHVTDWLSIVRGCLGLTGGLSIPAGVLVAATDDPVRNRDLMAAQRCRAGPDRAARDVEGVARERIRIPVRDARRGAHQSDRLTALRLVFGAGWCAQSSRRRATLVVTRSSSSSARPARMVRIA